MTAAIEQTEVPHLPARAFDRTMIRPEDLRRAVSIHYYGRSGSLFLQSLLDGHPQVVMTPGTYLAGFNRFWEMFGRLSAVKLLAAFITNYDILFDARSPVPVFQIGANVGAALGFDRMGEGGDQALGVDRDAFGEVLLGHVLRVCPDPGRNTLSRRYFLQAVHSAYAAALDRETAGRNMLMVLQTHNPYFDEVEPLYRDFGDDLRFLHCIREPVQALGSWYAHWWELCTGANPAGAPPLSELTGASLARGIDHAKPIFAQYAHHFEQEEPAADVIAWADENTRGVRLEDLHLQPRETLERLCAWLGIEWDDALLQSTFDGLPWQYRTTGGVTVSGFQKTTISKTHDGYITGFDRLRLKLLFADCYKAWNYPIHRLLTWQPMRCLGLLLWLLPLRMETAAWRGQPKRGLRALASILGSYAVVRVKVYRRWLVELRIKPMLIRMLD